MSNRVVDWSTKKSGVKIQGTGEGVPDMNFNETITPIKLKAIELTQSLYRLNYPAKICSQSLSRNVIIIMN